MPPKWDFFPKDRRYRARFVLLHKRHFFRMVPEGLNAFWTFVHAAEQCQFAFLASGKATNGVLSLRIAHIAPFYTINFFFLIAPRDLHYYWASAQPCAALRRPTTPFLASGNAPKMGFFP